MKQLYKLIMVDGRAYKFIFQDDINEARTWLNAAAPFISVNNTLINLRYVKRIKEIKRLRDCLPKVTLRKILIWTILWFMVAVTFSIIIWEN